MKKQFIFMFVALIVLLVPGCTSEAPLQENASEQATKQINIRTEEEAIEIAMNLVANNGSRSTVGIANVEKICSTPSRNNENTLIYAVNYADENGFALINAAKNGEAVLGFSDEGSYSEPEEGNGFAFYLDAAKDYVLSALSNQEPLDPIPNPDGPKITTESVLSKALSKFGPGTIENKYCEEQKCGSGPIAMAMLYSSLVYTHNLFTTEYLNLTYPERKVNKCLLDWSFIQNYESKENFYASCINCPNHESHEGFSHFLRELEYRSDTFHRTDKRIVTNLEDVKATMEGLDSSVKYTEIKNLTSLTEEAAYDLMGRGKVLFVEGYDEGTSGENGRERMEYYWLISGGQKTTRTSSVVDIYGQQHDIVDIDYLLFCNWGNFGKNNGYFYLGVYKLRDSDHKIIADYSNRLKYITQVD